MRADDERITLMASMTRVQIETANGITERERQVWRDCRLLFQLSLSLLKKKKEIMCMEMRGEEDKL